MENKNSVSMLQVNLLKVLSENKELRKKIVILERQIIKLKGNMPDHDIDDKLPELGDKI